MALQLKTPLFSGDGDDRPRPQHSTTVGGQVGGKNITSFGSWALTVNNITGPGMLYLAAVFQGAGFLIPTVAFFIICICSTGAATLLCDAIARMPGNKDLMVRYEYSDAFLHYFGKRAFAVSQGLFFLAIFTQAVASIVDTAQAGDGLIVQLFGKSWGLQIFPKPSLVTWTKEVYCGPDVSAELCIPFSSFGGAPVIDSVISAGYVLAVVLMMPLGFLNLDDNIKFQIASFYVLVFLCGEFIFDMVSQRGLDPSRLTLWGRGEYTTVVGTLMFNFAYCPTITSWLNEKRPEVRSGPILWISAISAITMMISVGCVSAMSFENAQGDLLQALQSGNSWPMTKICAFLFGVLVVGPGIPIFCIVMRYNLLVGGVCRPSLSIFWGVVFPWLFSWILYQGKATATFIAQAGVVILSVVGFLMPLFLALRASGVKTLGDMWKRVELQESAAQALPTSLLPQQRRYASALICLIIPLVAASIYTQVQNPQQ